MNYAKSVDHVDEVWTRTKEHIRESLDEQTYESWFAQLKIKSIRDEKMTLEVDHVYARNVLMRRFFDMIVNAIAMNFGASYDVEIVVRGEARLRPAQTEIPAGPAPGAHAQLNPRYTFDSFVVGASNRFAHAASLAVAELPSDAYNPLFLYGGAGLGKTHLMHAIGHYVARHTPEKRVMYVTSESFMNQLITNIAQNDESGKREMRDKFRNVDILMIDDIQILSGKPATQEEIFHTFNELHGNGKQIILSSDRPPKEIATLEERLRSRFEWGLIADIQRPDYETRVAILRKRAETDGIDVGDDVLHLIAERVDTNIRELEGALTRVNAKARFERQPITVELAIEALAVIIKGGGDKRGVDTETIMKTVAERYHIQLSDMTSARRSRDVALPRQMAMFLAREMTKLSTTRIGDAFGGRDHTTVMHACDKIAELAKEDPRVRETLSELRTTIKEG